MRRWGLGGDDFPSPEHLRHPDIVDKLQLRGRRHPVAGGRASDDVELQVIESLGSFYGFQNTSGSSGSYSLQITDVAKVGMPSPIGTFTVTDVGIDLIGNGIQQWYWLPQFDGSNTVSSVVFTSGLSGFLHAF